MLCGYPLLEDLHLLFVDDVGVGGDLSADDRLAESVSGLYDDLLGAAVGVDGEHDAGELGVDHPLDDDGELDVAVGEPLLLAVGDGPGGEEGGPAFPDLVEQVLLASDVEVGLLLAREAGVGEVLRGGAGPDGDESLLALGEQDPVPGDDLLLQVLGDLALLEHGPDLVGRGHQAVVGGPVDALEGALDLRHYVAALDEVVVGGGGEDESLRDREAGIGEFAEVSSLAPDDGYVFHVQLVYIDDLLVHGNPCETESV